MKPKNPLLKKSLPFIITTLMPIAFSFKGQAQWSINPAVNNAISTLAENQESPQIISDGAGGAIITWMDYRNAVDYDIYAQRINASGSIHSGWATNGEVICSAAEFQLDPKIVSDGAGGAIITWMDYRNGSNYDIYAQRIDASGSIHTGWTADGELICTATNDQININAVSDGVGGAIITWQDFRNGGDNDIYAQRIDALGNIHTGWTANGEVICSAGDNQTSPMIISDESEGAIITWQDFRNTGDYDIYAQRIDASGSIHSGWTTNGEVVCMAVDNQNNPTLVSDGSGGAYITWEDFRNGSNFDIYAQLIEASGNIHVAWTPDGEVICSVTGDQTVPVIAGDGAGGAFITWVDLRSVVGNDIYVQRIDESSSIHSGWTANGIGICTASGGQYTPGITVDGSGGVIISWRDYRNGIYNDIYTQRIDASGAIYNGWTADGVLICSAADHQYYTSIISDGSGGAIIAWQDRRDFVTTAHDIYAQKINSSGTLGVRTLNIYGNGAISIADGGGNIPSDNDSTYLTGVINTSLMRRYTIQNTGASAITIYSIVSSGANAGDFVVTNYNTTIGAGSSGKFIITFNPTTTGTKNGVITMSSNDATASEYNFAIQGNGITTYTYTGTGYWTDAGKWSPAYPGLIIPEGITVDVKFGSVLNIDDKFITNNGTLINNGTLDINTGIFSNNGTYKGSGAYSGGIFLNPPGGNLSPGD